MNDFFFFSYRKIIDPGKIFYIPFFSKKTPPPQKKKTYTVYIYIHTHTKYPSFPSVVFSPGSAGRAVALRTVLFTGRHLSLLKITWRDVSCTLLGSSDDKLGRDGLLREAPAPWSTSGSQGMNAKQAADRYGRI